MRLGRVALIVTAMLVAVGLLAPVAFAVRVSFSPDSFLSIAPGEWSLRWYEAFFTDRRWVHAAGRSVLVAVLAAGVAVVAGTPLAFAVARHRFRGRTALDVAATLPAYMPAAALGTGLLPVFHLLRLSGSVTGLALAHGLLGLPIVYLVVHAHLRAVGVDLEAAARGLGATPWQAVRRVTMPMVQPAVMVAALAAAVGSLNEPILALFLTAPSSETVPAVAWPQLRYAASPLVSVTACLSTLVAGGVTILILSIRSSSNPRP